MTRQKQEACAICARLHNALREARRAGDLSRAVDCRVLLRRHPVHDFVPVPDTGDQPPTPNSASNTPDPA